MNHLTAAVVLVVVSACAVAADGPPRSQFTSAAPALRLVERPDSYEKGSFARWTGKLELTGKVVVEFGRPEPGGEQQDDVGVVFFEPSPGSMRQLPAAIGRYYPLQPKVLWLGGTPSEVLSPLLGSEAVRRLVVSKPPRFEVPAKLQLLELYTSVECDHRSYELTYEKLVLLSPEMLAVGKAENIGC